MSDLIYTDGGCVLKNPSPYGGGWAWCRILDGEIVAQDSGLVMPADVGLPAISNNLTELLAAVQALEAIADNHPFAALLTDSFVTQCRLTFSAKFAGIPAPLRERCLDQRRRKSPFKVVLLGGHPSKAALAHGHRADGLPVSKWNVWCDQACRRHAAECERTSPDLARLREAKAVKL